MGEGEREGIQAHLLTEKAESRSQDFKLQLMARSNESSILICTQSILAYNAFEIFYFGSIYIPMR